MEKLVNKIALFLTTPLQYDSEKRAVVQYGLFAIMQILIVAILISIFGALFKCFFECWIVYLAVAFLRRSTGGAHAKTSNGCLVVSVSVVSIIGLLSHYLSFFSYGYTIGFAVSIVSFLISCFIIYKYAPVGSKNKPLNKPEKIKRLRRQSFYTLIIFALIVLLFFILSIWFKFYMYFAVSLCLSVFWQSLTVLIAALKKKAVVDKV